MIRSVLVAVDGSENAKRAVRLASQVARSAHAGLSILHVVTIPVAAYSGGAVDTERLEEDARREGEKFLADAVAVARQEGIEAKTAIAESMDSPVKGIIDYAEASKVDVIVVGTRGLGRFKRLLLGSVASGVLHYAHCSVLVVR